MVPDPEAAARADLPGRAANLVAVSKPAGTLSDPLREGELGTAASGLVARYPECALVGDDPREAGLVHRLDGDTTRVLIAARDAATWAALRAAFGAGAVTKRYLLRRPRRVPYRLRREAALRQRGARVVVDEAEGLAARPTSRSWPSTTAWPGSAAPPTPGACTRSVPTWPRSARRWCGPTSATAARPTSPGSSCTPPRSKPPIDGQPVRITAPLPDDRARRVRALGLMA